MPFEQTITIVNNSGNIISTGKRLLSMFNEVKGAYQDKKAELQSERPTFQRSQTLDYREDDRGYKYEYGPGPMVYNGEYAPERACGDHYTYSRRRSHDVCSQTSPERSHRSRHHGHRGAPNRPALTEHNLKTLSEASGTAPSKAPPPVAYRSPYAETLPMDAALSKLHLSHPQRPSIASLGRGGTVTVPRRRSEPRMGGGYGGSSSINDLDMDLAYGNIPPDLEQRIDLDPSRAAELDELRAQQLVHKVEHLLFEAHCLHHSATATIKHLQEKPDAAAEVALTLADLSSVVSKMSPALLGFLKGGSPAVFALLASPQFLIGTGIAVGVTVVMFGGWKIVKKVQETQTSKDVVAHTAMPMRYPSAEAKMQSEYSASIDEALVVDDELSTIETWRRGIMPFGAGDESADLELITPEADRVAREKCAKDDLDSRPYRSGRTRRSSKMQRMPHLGKSKEKNVSKSKSSRDTAVDSVSGGNETRCKRPGKGKEKSTSKAMEVGRSWRGDDAFDVAFRPKVRHGNNMLKAIFKDNKDKGKASSGRELVLA